MARKATPEMIDTLDMPDAPTTLEMPDEGAVSMDDHTLAMHALPPILETPDEAAPMEDHSLETLIVEAPGDSGTPQALPAQAVPEAVSTVPTPVMEPVLEPTPPAAAPLVPLAILVPAAEPDTAPVYGAPYGFADDGWMTNEVVVTGVIAPPRPRRDGKKQRPWTAPVRMTSDGGRYKVFQVDINEHTGAMDLDGDLVMTRLETLIPIDDSLIEALEKQGGTVSLRGRLEQKQYRDVREERRLEVVDGGVYLRRTESVIARQVVLVDPQEAHYAVGHLTGTVQRVLALHQPIQRGDAQHYHTVRMQVTELRPRRAPARGHEQVTTQINVLVPVDFPHAEMLLRVGNPMALEYGVKRVVNWLSDQQMILVREEERDRARQRQRDEWIVSFIAPQTGAEAPDAELLEQVRTETRQRQQQRRRTAGQRRTRQTRMLQEKQDGVLPLAPAPVLVPDVKRRRVHTDSDLVETASNGNGHHATRIPAMDVMDLHGGSQ